MRVIIIETIKPRHEIGPQFMVQNLFEIWSKHTLKPWECPISLMHTQVITEIEFTLFEASIEWQMKVLK